MIVKGPPPSQETVRTHRPSLAEDRVNNPELYLCVEKQFLLQ